MVGRRLILLAALTACGPRAPTVAPDDEAYGADGEGTDLEDLPEARQGPPGKAPRLRAPLPDGWPREPIEPLPLQGTTRTLLDHADPVARFVVDFPAPGHFELTLHTAKATDFKARVVLYDSLGTTLEELTLTDAWTMTPRALLPGTLYLLVERNAGVAELVVTADFKGEAAPEE